MLNYNVWRGGRVVECTGFENRHTARYRRFESSHLRKFCIYSYMYSNTYLNTYKEIALRFIYFYHIHLW